MSDVTILHGDCLHLKCPGAHCTHQPQPEGNTMTDTIPAGAGPFVNHDDTIDLAAELVMLQDSAQRIDERIGVIKARLIELHDNRPGDYPAGPYRVRVKAGATRLDPARVLAKYPPHEHPELYKPTVITGKVRELVAPVMLGELSVQGAPTVVVE